MTVNTIMKGSVVDYISSKLDKWIEIGESRWSSYSEDDNKIKELHLELKPEIILRKKRHHGLQRLLSGRVRVQKIVHVLIAFRRIVQRQCAIDQTRRFKHHLIPRIQLHIFQVC